jgi:hypothetical protein
LRDDLLRNLCKLRRVHRDPHGRSGVVGNVYENTFRNRDRDLDLRGQGDLRSGCCLRRGIDIGEPGEQGGARLGGHFGECHAAGFSRGVSPNDAGLAFDTPGGIDGDAEMQILADRNAAHQREAQATSRDVFDHAAIFAAELDIDELGRLASGTLASFRALNI